MTTAEHRRLAVRHCSLAATSVLGRVQMSPRPEMPMQSRLLASTIVVREAPHTALMRKNASTGFHSLSAVVPFYSLE
jgi:hypothetical protein